MELYIIAATFMTIGAVIGGHRGGWSGAIIGFLLGPLGLFGWVAAAWLTREGTKWNPAPPPNGEDPASTKAEDDGTCNTQIWRLQKKIRGTQTCMVVILIWSVLLVPIYLSMTAHREHYQYMRTFRELKISDQEAYTVGVISNGGPGFEKIVDESGKTYWVSMVFTADNAAKTNFVFASSRDGKPRLELFDAEGKSAWHAP